MTFEHAYLGMHNAMRMPDKNMQVEQTDYLDRYIGPGDAAYHYSIRLRKPCDQKTFATLLKQEIELAKKRQRSCFEWKTCIYPQVPFSYDLSTYQFKAPQCTQLMWHDCQPIASASPHIQTLKVDNLTAFEHMLDILDQVFGKRSAALNEYFNQGLKKEIFETPDLVQAIITSIDKQPACVGWVKIYNKVATLFAGGTLKNMRKKGAYTENVRARMAFAREHHCQYIISESSPDSQKALSARGFHDAGQIQSWVYRFTSSSS